MLNEPTKRMFLGDYYISCIPQYVYYVLHIIHIESNEIVKSWLRMKCIVRTGCRADC